MSNKPRFVAKTINNQIIEKTGDAVVPTFNLSNLNLLELSKELERSLNKPSSTFIIFRNRENKKLELQREKANLILKTIEDLKLTQQELTKFQADTFLSNEMLEAVIDSKRQEIINLAAIKKKEFLITHKALDDQLLRIEHEQRAREAALTSAEMEIRRKEAEIQSIKNQDELTRMIALSNIRYQDAKTNSQREIVNILKRISTDEEFMENMPPEQKTLTILTTINQAITEYKDTDVLKLLKDLTFEKERVAIEKERATLPQIVERGEQEKLETKNKRLKLERQQKRDEAI